MANVVGTKWGSSKLGTAGGTVTWSIAGAGVDITRFGVSTSSSVNGNSFLTIDYKSVIASAFAEWSKYGDIEFQQVADGGGAAGIGQNADIRIFFGEIPGATAGYAFYPSAWGSAIAGDILFDTLTLFNHDPDMLFNLALHEIGHSLGLGHSNGNSIMTANVRKIGLQADDIAGIQKIYGVQDSAPNNGGNNPVEPAPVEPAPVEPTPEDPIVVTPPTQNEPVSSGKTGKVVGGTSSTDSLWGSGGDDSIYGFGGNDFLGGGKSNDQLRAGQGNDDVNGHAGSDYLVGGPGSDIVRGGKDNDTLVGGSGDDKLWGGADADIFVFSNNGGNNVIADFNANSSAEKIDFSGLSALNNLWQVKNAAVQQGSNVKITIDADETLLLQNVNLNQLDASDFIF